MKEMKRYIKELAHDIHRYMDKKVELSNKQYSDFSWDIYRAYSLYQHGLITENDIVNKLVNIWNEIKAI